MAVWNLPRGEAVAEVPKKLRMVVGAVNASDLGRVCGSGGDLRSCCWHVGHSTGASSWRRRRRLLMHLVMAGRAIQPTYPMLASSLGCDHRLRRSVVLMSSLAAARSRRSSSELEARCCHEVFLFRIPFVRRYACTDCLLLFSSVGGRVLRAGSSG